jgi:hypothetical protein
MFELERGYCDGSSNMEGATTRTMHVKAASQTERAPLIEMEEIRRRRGRRADGVGRHACCGRADGGRHNSVAHYRATCCWRSKCPLVVNVPVNATLAKLSAGQNVPCQLE